MNCIRKPCKGQIDMNCIRNPCKGQIDMNCIYIYKSFVFDKIMYKKQKNKQTKKTSQETTAQKF